MPNYRLSFQLYSARNFPPLSAQLEHLGRIGFDAVEPFGGSCGEEPAALRAMLDANGLTCPSAHFGLAALDDDLSKVIDTAKVLGMETVIVPAVQEREQDVDGWKALGAKLQNHAAALADAGLRFAWHNHAFEYVTLADGSRPIDHLLSGDKVFWEADLGWVVRGGGDIAAELARFQGKPVAIHVKDLAPEGVTADDGWTNVGSGTIDWPAAMKAIGTTGADLLVLEHDAPSDWLDFAEKSYAYIAGLVGRN